MEGPEAEFSILLTGLVPSEKRQEVERILASAVREARDAGFAIRQAEYLICVANP